MAGLLGSLVAGAAGGYAKGRSEELTQQNEFNLKTALMDAQMEKDLRLKEAGYQMDQQHADEDRQRKAGYFDDVQGDDGTHPASIDDAAARAFKAGDIESGSGLLGSKSKPETYTLGEGQKLVGADGKVIAEGNPKIDKLNETERAVQARMERTGETYDQAYQGLKKEIAIAGRAPTRPSDDDQTYTDWKRKPENKGKGRDDYVKWKARINDSDGNVTITERYDGFGNYQGTSKSKRGPVGEVSPDGPFKLDSFF